MMRNQPIGAIVVTVCLLAGCVSTAAGGGPTTTEAPPDPPATLQDNQTPQVRRPTSTSTVTPTTPSTADILDVPLSRKGPWLIFLAANEEGGPPYLWGINDDGTGLTRLVDEPVRSFDVRPDSSVSLGATIAYVAYAENGVPGYMLKLLSLPDNEVTAVTPLLSDASVLEGIWNTDLDYSIVHDGLKWSPGGSLLAFVGALNSPSIDVYTYDFSSGIITRLSDRPSHAYRLQWSPDGSHLVYEGFMGIGMGGLPEFPDIWAEKADGTGTIRLIQEADFKDVVYSRGWISAAEIVLVNQFYRSEDENSDIRIVNLATGETTLILEEPFFNEAFAAQYNTWLLTTSYRPTPETSLILYRQGQRQEIPGMDITNVQWLSDQNLFLGQTDHRLLYTITADGKITRLPMGAEWKRYGGPYSIFASPDGQLWAWYMRDWGGSASDLWVGDPMAEPIKILSTLGVPDLTHSKAILVDGFDWSPDSQRLLILTRRGLWMAERPGFEPILITNRLYSNPWDTWQGEWIP